MPIGFTLPFSKTTTEIGHFETTSDELSAVNENIKSLLLTNWGERVGHYYFGCNLRSFLFENASSEELKLKITDRITGQVGTWLPFVSINILNVLFSEDDESVPENSILIKIEFSITSKPDARKSLQISVNQ